MINEFIVPTNIHWQQLYCPPIWCHSFLIECAIFLFYLFFYFLLFFFLLLFVCLLFLLETNLCRSLFFYISIDVGNPIIKMLRTNPTPLWCLSQITTCMIYSYIAVCCCAQRRGIDSSSFSWYADDQSLTIFFSEQYGCCYDFLSLDYVYNICNYIWSLYVE